MDIKDRRFYETLKKILDNHYHKILSVDLTANRYEVISVDDSEWQNKQRENISERISEWFTLFADGEYCHESDRERFKQFTDLNNLRELFEKNSFEPVSIIYRRKFDLTEYLYSNVMMELYPEITDDGHLTAFLFVRDLTSEITKDHAIVETELARSRYVAEKRTVLVVEDNELNREILAEILSDRYTVLQAENGAEGLAVLQEHMSDIALIVLDVQMPVMNGYEFLEQVKKDPFLSEIPVVVATGSDSLEEERICLQLGASDFVTKPYNPDIIRSRIAGIIKLRESKATVAMLQTDERTGLYTLQAFYYYAKQTIDLAGDKSYSVTIFDIDHFKTINDVYGEQIGDKVLHEIAEVLKDYTAAAEVYARFGAARFLLLSETMTAEKTDAWIRGLFDKLQRACSIKGITFKAGIYADVDKSLPVSLICDRAISALNSVEQSAENRYALYDKAHADKERRIAVMEADMHKAYENEQFSVYYQPKHDAVTGRLVGAEALIRWIHPELGFLSPGEFIPLFERNGFVSYADRYVLQRTCKNLRSWINEGITPVPISVNASRRDFESGICAVFLLHALQEYNLEPELIHIEVTESLFSDRMEEISRLLQDCRAEGFLIELDDFGAGYSSLTTLASLPIDIMKLDMSFMKNFRDEKKRKVLSTCINLAHSLGMKTVSEGVETEEQLDLLRSYGCDFIQGYYYSRPLPESEFREYLIRYTEKNNTCEEIG